MVERKQEGLKGGGGVKNTFVPPSLKNPYEKDVSARKALVQQKFAEAAAGLSLALSPSCSLSLLSLLPPSCSRSLARSFARSLSRARALSLPPSLSLGVCVCVCARV